jgi:hypothetical protein
VLPKKISKKLNDLDLKKRTKQKSDVFILMKDCFGSTKKTCFVE